MEETGNVHSIERERKSILRKPDWNKSDTYASINIRSLSKHHHF